MTMMIISEMEITVVMMMMLIMHIVLVLLYSLFVLVLLVFLLTPHDCRSMRKTTRGSRS